MQLKVHYEVVDINQFLIDFTSGQPGYMESSFRRYLCNQKADRNLPSGLVVLMQLPSIKPTFLGMLATHKIP